MSDMSPILAWPAPGGPAAAAVPSLAASPPNSSVVPSPSDAGSVEQMGVIIALSVLATAGAICICASLVCNGQFAYASIRFLHSVTMGEWVVEERKVRGRYRMVRTPRLWTVRIAPEKGREKKAGKMNKKRWGSLDPLAASLVIGNGPRTVAACPPMPDNTMPQTQVSVLIAMPSNRSGVHVEPSISDFAIGTTDQDIFPSLNDRLIYHP
ncbi:hypothetical protein BXZ70DRAFT_543552 [Cristinia sonorae]|uniref:Uncharacterized protein n=1 Tax=Cristinia sonorae TaxID=1940300 RepID=A0A8K0UH97_9AGAR|nr:hypothetical protein BXZ70DRAFT_543552 [Cristinia sonorae]